MRRSQRLKRFLEYIVEQRLEGHEGEISETQIAFQVFARRPDYDPSSDNVVRVQARLLRQKLAEYFAGPGAHEPLIIEIPKGGYVPNFIIRQPEPGIPRTVPAEFPKSSRLVYGLALLCFALLCSTLWLGWRVATARSGVVSERTLANAVLRPDEPCLLVVPDLGLVVAQIITGKTFTLDKYAGGAAYRNELFADISLREPRRVFGYLISKHLTDTFAAQLHSRLVREHRNAASKLELRHPRAIRLGDLHGVNAILLGSPRSNPWLDAYRNELTFHFSPVAQGGEVVVNVRPKAGEPTVFSSPPLSVGAGKALAVISLIPNPRAPGNVLLLAGTAAGATSAAIEAAITGGGMRLLEQALNVRHLADARRFEVVLSVNVVDDSATDWTPIAHRITY